MFLRAFLALVVVLAGAGCAVPNGAPPATAEPAFDFEMDEAPATDEVEA